MDRQRKKESQDLWRQARRFCEPDRLSANDRKRRERLEKNTLKWLRYYFPGIYRRKWGDVHRDIVAAADYTISTGGRYVVAAPRGSGKSFILTGCCLKAVCDGRRRFPVLIPWCSKGLKKALSFWLKALCFNELLAADYPEICYPFVHSRGSSQNCLALTHQDGRPIGARILLSEGMIALPDSRGVIGGSTVNGNPLGLNYTTNSGLGLRPDLVFIDDPQDRETATSRTQILATIDQIDKDIAGMAGPDVDMPMMMANTVKHTADVAEHYLNAGGDWRAQRTAQITAWPLDFEKEKSPMRQAWFEWNQVRLAGHDERDNGLAGIEHYVSNKRKLAKGMRVSWNDRFREGEPDAKYSAMLDFFVMGEGPFMAERQNAPRDESSTLYDLTPANVISSMVDIPRFSVLGGYNILVGHCDINRIGLHYCLAAFSQDMTGHTPQYGRFPAQGELWRKNAPELERKQAIFVGLKHLCDEIQTMTFTIDGKGLRLQTLLVDRGYEPDVVNKFCQHARYSFRVIPARGYAAHKYAPRKSMLIGRPMEGCHMSNSDYGPYLAFNADMWRETGQRAFLAEPGAPGGFTLFRAGAERFHSDFAEHNTAERLLNKYNTDSGMRWEWTLKPGTPNDWGDALTGCYVAAAAAGLSPSGMPSARRKPKRETRTSKVGIAQ